MADSAAEAQAPAPSRKLAAQIPTGAKIFLILSAALLPLAIIAFFASLKTTQTADETARAQLRLASAESARKLAIELVGDMTALRVALNALDADQGDAPSCARAQGVFAQQAVSGTRFIIRDRRARALCGADFPSDLAPLAAGTDPIAARIAPGRGLVLAIAGATGATATAFFPTRFLAETGRPSDFAPPYEAVLMRGSDLLAR